MSVDIFDCVIVTIIPICIKHFIPDAAFSLPWYIKVYWALFNATVPMAFFITIYYYSLLAGFVGK